MQKTLSRLLCQIERSLSTRHVLFLELNAWLIHLPTELNMFMACSFCFCSGGRIFLVTFTGSGVGSQI